MGFDSLIDILKKAQAKYPALSKRMKEADAVARWETAVGTLIAKHALAIRVQDDVLWVEVDHPIWKSELHHRKHQILKILNSNDSSTAGVLKDIYFIDPRAISKPRFSNTQPVPKKK